MIIKTVGEVFNAGSLATYPTFTAGTLQSGSLGDDHDHLVITFIRTGTAPTKLYAKVELENPHDTGNVARGSVPQINGVSGGITDWDDNIHDLPNDTSRHQFWVPMMGGYDWKVSFAKTGGDATTTIVARADVHKKQK